MLDRSVSAGQECAAATRIASRNGARLSSCRLSLGADGRSGTVVVRVVATVQLPLVGESTVFAASAPAGRVPASSPLSR